MAQDHDYDDQKDEPTKRQEQDFDTPFSPADDTGKQHIPPDHPAGDDPVDSQELYDEGSDDATSDNAGTERGEGPGPRKVF